MIKLYDGGVYLVGGNKIVPEAEAAGVPELQGACPEEAKKGTIAYSILKAHNQRGQKRYDRLLNFESA